MVRRSPIAILLAVLLGCSGNLYDGTRAAERSDWWEHEISRLANEEPTLETLSAALENLGADEPLKVGPSGDYYAPTLETIKGEDLPCGYANIKIIVSIDSSGDVEAYGVGPSAVCVAAEAE